MENRLHELKVGDVILVGGFDETRHNGEFIIVALIQGGVRVERRVAQGLPLPDPDPLALYNLFTVKGNPLIPPGVVPKPDLEEE